MYVELSVAEAVRGIHFNREGSLRRHAARHTHARAQAWTTEQASLAATHSNEIGVHVDGVGQAAKDNALVDPVARVDRRRKEAMRQPQDKRQEGRRTARREAEVGRGSAEKEAQRSKRRYCSGQKAEGHQQVAAAVSVAMV